MDDIQRKTIISKARSLYIPMVTDNISVALKLFLKNDATVDEQIPIVISRKSRPANWVDRMGRPTCPKCNIGLTLNMVKNIWQCDLCMFEKEIRIKDCPECSKQMMLRPVNVSRCTKIGGGYNSMWLCKNEECMNTIYNKETIQEILMEGK